MPALRAGAPEAGRGHRLRTRSTAAKSPANGNDPNGILSCFLHCERADPAGKGRLQRRDGVRAAAITRRRPRGHGQELQRVIAPYDRRAWTGCGGRGRVGCARPRLPLNPRQGARRRQEHAVDNPRAVRLVTVTACRSRRSPRSANRDARGGRGRASRARKPAPSGSAHELSARSSGRNIGTRPGRIGSDGSPRRWIATIVGASRGSRQRGLDGASSPLGLVNGTEDPAIAASGRKRTARSRARRAPRPRFSHLAKCRIRHAGLPPCGIPYRPGRRSSASKRMRSGSRSSCRSLSMPRRAGEPRRVRVDSMLERSRATSRLWRPAISPSRLRARVRRAGRSCVPQSSSLRARSAPRGVMRCGPMAAARDVTGNLCAHWELPIEDRRSPLLSACSRGWRRRAAVSMMTGQHGRTRAARARLAPGRRSCRAGTVRGAPRASMAAGRIRVAGRYALAQRSYAASPGEAAMHERRSRRRG